MGIVDAPELEIRPFRESDRCAVEARWRECGLVKTWNDPGKDICRKLHAQGELFLVGLLGDRLVATVMAGYEGHRGWINYLAVGTDYRNRGFGRRLMEAAESRLRDLGCPKINLQVRSSNHAAVTFYKHIGYAIDDVVSMGKRLEED